MFTQPPSSLLPYLFQSWVGCTGPGCAELLLLGLLSWFSGFVGGVVVVLFVVSRSLRNVIWGLAGVVVRELHPIPPVVDRLARYRAPAHESRDS